MPVSREEMLDAWERQETWRRESDESEEPAPKPRGSKVTFYPGVEATKQRRWRVVALGVLAALAAGGAAAVVVTSRGASHRAPAAAQRHQPRPVARTRAHVVAAISRRPARPHRSRRRPAAAKRVAAAPISTAPPQPVRTPAPAPVRVAPPPVSHPVAPVAPPPARVAPPPARPPSHTGGSGGGSFTSSG